MHLSHLCLASFLCSASSFTPRASLGPAARSTTINSHGTIVTKTALSMGEDGALFGDSASVPGLPDKLPKAPPVDEDNPMGGQMFRKMMERAKEGKTSLQAQSQSQTMGQNQQQQPQMGQQVQPMQQMQQSPQYGSVPQQQPQQMQPNMQMQQPGIDPYATYQTQLQAWQQQMTAFAQFSAANPEAAAQMTMPPPPQPPTQQQNFGVPQQQPQQFQQPPPQPVQQQPTVNTLDPTPSDPNKKVNPYDYLPKGDGRNSQAYEVNNASDIYFAQLKRDSTIRTEARKSGDLATANNVFGDHGVKALSGLFSDELLESRRKRLEESGGEFETSRDEMILPQHFIGSGDDTNKSYTGVSYKERLLNSKSKRSGVEGDGAGDGINAPVAPVTPVAAAPSAVSEATTSQFVPKVESFDLASTAPNTEQQQQEQQSQANFALSVKDEKDIDEIAAPSMEDSEEKRRSIRTLMGLLLKHRGGPGFGHGRLVGDEAANLEAAVPEIVSLLNSEAGIVGGAPSLSATSAATATPGTEREQMSPLTGSVACVEAAMAMYKNADASTQSELIMPLRDALLSAVNTINKVVAEEELSATQSSSPSAAVAAAAAAPEPVYATTMDFPETYEVTRPEEEDLQEIAEVIANSSTSSGAEVLSENTARLQKVLDALKAISGDKKLGLRDVSKEEVSGNEGM